MARYLPRGGEAWEAAPTSLSVRDRYEQGYSGLLRAPDTERLFRAKSMETGGYANVAEASRVYGWAGAGEGKLVAPYVLCQEMYPNCWPGAPQEVGDCVSHGTSNAIFTTAAFEIAFAKTQGGASGLPVVDPRGVKDCVFSTEYLYWWRGYGGDGWDCQDATRMAIEHGMMLRNNYPDIGIDLREYSGGLAHRYGSKSPPANIEAIGKEHQITTAAACNSFEEVRDALYNGHGVVTDGGEGWSSNRDENGLSRRSGSWSHSMCCIAADDRDCVKKKYGEPLICILNSWGVWNSGSRRIMESKEWIPPSKRELWIKVGICDSEGFLLIPEGAYWTTYSSAKNRDFVACAGMERWARAPVTDYLPCFD